MPVCRIHRGFRILRATVFPEHVVQLDPGIRHHAHSDWGINSDWRHVWIHIQTEKIVGARVLQCLPRERSHQQCYQPARFLLLDSVHVISRELGGRGTKRWYEKAGYCYQILMNVIFFGVSAQICEKVIQKNQRNFCTSVHVNFEILYTSDGGI